MASSNILIVIGVITAVTGLIAGVLIVLLVQGLRKNKPVPSAEDSRAQLFKEVGRLWRDRASGRLMVEVDGRMQAGAAGLSEAHRTELSVAATELLAWLGKPLAEPAAPAPARTPTPALVAATPSAAKAPEAVRPATIVEQIDAILQEKLETSPLAGQGIRLAEEPEHGVVVWVGLQRYAGIESVPEPAITALIRAAVADWERQSSAGRS